MVPVCAVIGHINHKDIARVRTNTVETGMSFLGKTGSFRHTTVVLCALAMAFISFSHRAVEAGPSNGDIASFYVLPDGSVLSACINSPKTDGKGGHARACDFCVIAHGGLPGKVPFVWGNLHPLGENSPSRDAKSTVVKNSTRNANPVRGPPVILPAASA
jgi:hypothetical protein